MDEIEARKAAEEFARTRTANWDEWDFCLQLIATPATKGVYGFTYSPRAKDELGGTIRIGGNWPIIVDPDTGACRAVHGVKEMVALRNPEAGPVRFHITRAQRRRL